MIGAKKCVRSDLDFGTVADATRVVYELARRSARERDRRERRQA